MSYRTPHDRKFYRDREKREREEQKRLDELERRLKDPIEKANAHLWRENLEIKP